MMVRYASQIQAHLHGGTLLLTLAGTDAYAAAARFSKASETATVPSKSTKTCETVGTRPLSAARTLVAATKNETERTRLAMAEEQ